VRWRRPGGSSGRRVVLRTSHEPLRAGCGAQEDGLLQIAQGWVLWRCVVPPGGPAGEGGHGHVGGRSGFWYERFGVFAPSATRRKRATPSSYSIWRISAELLDGKRCFIDAMHRGGGLEKLSTQTARVQRPLRDRRIVPRIRGAVVAFCLHFWLVFAATFA